MKRLPLLFLISLLAVFGLAACTGDVYQRAYIAAGDGTAEKDLTADEQFTPTEDINVVIKLGRRDETLSVQTRFIDPNGDVLEDIEAEAPSRVGTVVMGLDYQSRDDVAQGGGWRTGRYKVEIRLDNELVDTLYFRVD
jgi:hypothetical protein